jgi:TPR repeat protein
MLMDVSLKETYEKSMRGDKKATFDLAYAYHFGRRGAPKDKTLAREIFIKLVDDEDKDFFAHEYGRLYTIVGHCFERVNNPRKAKEYFIKAKKYILEWYIPEYAKELIEHHKLEELIQKYS